MLWPIVLPVQITLAVLGALFVVALLVSRKLSWKPQRVFAWGTLIFFLAFLPSCTLIMVVVDQSRFGIFEYSDFQSVDDFRVELYLPAPAKQITIEKSFSRFRAKFQISKPALDAWFDRHWEQYGEHSVSPRAEIDTNFDSNSDLIELRFADLGWQVLNDSIRYQSPEAPNGAGFTLWYSESTQTAYQYAGYW